MEEKVAPTVRLCVIDTVQSRDDPADAQSPVQPEKNEFAPFVVRACRVTEAPVSNEAVQLAPQLMPAGELVTVPTPEPVLVTVSGNLVAFTR